MRIRLVHTQSLFLLVAVLAAVLCTGALNAWNLRQGFAEFLAARDVERLEQFAVFVGRHAERLGGVEALKSQGPDLGEWLRRFAREQTPTPDHPPLPNVNANADASGSGATAIARPPLTEKGSAFRERVAIYTLDGQPLFEKTVPSDARLYVERAVRVRGEVQAWVRMRKLTSTSDAVEAHFLKSQYTSMAVVALVLLCVALVCARWASARWIRLLVEIQTATDRIAAGQFDVRLNDTRSDEIGDVMRNVNRMAYALQQLDESRRQWIADMSHELRTPLSVLRGEIDALADGVRPLNHAAVLSLREDALQLNLLVDDLHLLAMSDLNALPCYFEECDALDILHKTVDRFALRAQQRGLDIALEVTPLAACGVRWDSHRILQLWANLLDNSLRYTDAPGRVVVKLWLDADQVLMDIYDSAPSVSTQDLARVFEPLYRADVARSRHTGGSGLGLAICHAIVRAHRGSIEARASAMGGLHIHIALPRLVDNLL